ncbi:MAG: NAD(P)/FAD-dependent oxidoreductase [Ardenticatenaceae bacterium]
MDLISGYPFWPIRDGLIASYPTLKEDVTCQVAIIGAGITGALVAYYLSDAGMDVVLLDKRDAATGSTSATTGLLLYEIDTHLVELIKMIGREHAERAYQLCLEAIHKLEELARELEIECGLQRRKSLYLASQRTDVGALQAEYEARHAIGIRLDFLQQSEIEALFPFSYPAALLSHDAGQVDAYRLAHGLLQAAIGHGARVYDRTEIARHDPQGSRVVLTTSRGCQVRAGKVIFATGYETQQYLQQKIVTLRSTYALVSEPLDTFDGWYEKCLFWESARPYFYGRATDDGRAMVGGEDEDFADPAQRDRLIPDKTRVLREHFRQMFPAIEMDVAYSWAGTFGQTRDGLAYIGETPEFPNAYFTLGYGGNGITFGLIAAEIIRDLYLGRDNPDAQIFRFER